MTEKGEGFLHSWFMYSSTLFRSEDIQAEQSRHDTLNMGPVCLSRSSDITVNLDGVRGGGGSHFSSYSETTQLHLITDARN